MVSVLSSKKHTLADLYRPEMPKVGQAMFIFQKLLSHFFPRIFDHFEKEGMHPTMYASQWFVTIFSYNFPFEVVTRIWDIFLFEGWKVVYRIALALIKMNKGTVI